ncbi:MAG: YDG domain-containing protein, partial [Comamonadaceae bacterium]
MKRHASMNRVYRIVWNEQNGSAVAVAELVRGRGKRSVRGLALTASLIAGTVFHGAYAAPGANQLPTGAQVVSGLASVTQSGNAMTVRQGSDKLVANWSTFNIGKDASVQFVQPGSSSVALNRISDNSASQIFGSLSANGQVFLLNPSGIVFGPTARVDVGSLVASTLDLSNENFLSGSYQFARNGFAGSVVNQGVIQASGGAGSVVAFIAPQVSNSGSITASGGNVALAAGDKVNLDFSGNGLIKVQVDQGTFNALAENKGLIQADGGAVIMTAKTASDLMDAVVNNEGTIQARTLQNKAGRIMLLADMAHGETRVGGTLDASAPDGGDGGFIETSGAHVKVTDSMRLTTQAPTGKSGNWLIDPVFDYTISPTGDMPGAILASSLLSSDVTILSSLGGTAGNGDIYVDEHVFISGGLTPHILTLQAVRDIVFKAGSAIDATGNAAISVLLQSNATDAVGGGAVVMLPGSAILSSGGSITLSGGSSPLTTTYAVGRDGLGAVGGAAGLGGGADAGNGIALIGATLNSAGGNILLRGKSVNGGSGPVPLNSAGHVTADGVFINEGPGPVGSVIDSGAGTITIEGLATGAITAPDFGYAISHSLHSSISSSNTSASAIRITGDATGVTSTTGSGTDGFVSDGLIAATGGGGVTIIGKAAPVGMASGFLSGPSTAIVLNGPVLTSGGSGGTVNLQATGGLGMQGSAGAIATGNLLLTGDSFNLKGQTANGLASNNVVGTLAANVTGSGGLYFMNTGDLAIGSVGGTSGVTMGASGGFTAIATSGNLFIVNPVSSSYNGLSNGGLSVALVAGNQTAVGAVSGGDIRMSALMGTPFGLPNGGSMGLFTTSISGSQTPYGFQTLASLISAGNFRYNSSFELGKISGGSPDYTLTAGYTTALGNGLNLIYREQPAVTLFMGSQTLTYGVTPVPGMGISGLVNSDPPGTPVIVGSKSTSGNYIVGVDPVTAPPDLANLGYAMSSVPGSVIIQPATISAVTGITAASRTYDATTTATLNTGAAGFTGMVAGDVLTVASAAGAFANKNVGVGKTVSISGISLSGADAGNYTLASSVASASANITPASISAITGVTAANRAYDGTTNATINTGSAGFTGMVAGDVLTVAGGVGAFADKNVGNAKVVNISAMGLGGTDAGNYTLASSTGAASANITAASLSVSGATAQNK